MAGGKIRKSDVIEDKKIIKALQAIKDKIDGNVSSLKKFVDQAKKINKALGSAKTFKEFNEQVVKAEKNIKDLTDEEKRLIKSTKELAFQTSAAGKKQAVATEQTRRARKANREYAQSQLAATKSTNTFSKAIGSFLFKANFLANVMSNLASKIAQFAKKVIQDGIRGVVSFDAAITDVRAVAQATDEQFQALRDSAIALGGATKFTATQVAELQKEFAKLGFTSDQIIQLQESTLKLATATGAELAPAAKVVGGALRAFGKDASQARSVAATLAIATTKSALAFEDYETILSTVAPVANAYNFSLEDTVALLGQLKNANFDASKASTATRNILLNLADANGDLAKALGGNVNTLEDMVAGLIQLRNEGVDLATTLELTDKRSVAAFNTFLIGAENALVLRDQITGVNDELDEMVNVQLSSLENKITLLNSAWQGFVQATVDVNDGTDKAKQGVDVLTTALQGLTKGVKLENEILGEFGRITKSLTSPILRAIRFSVFWGTAINDLGEETEDTNDDLETLISNLNDIVDVDTDKLKSGLRAIGQVFKEGFKKIFEEVTDTGAIIDQVIPIEEIEKNLDEVLFSFNDFQDEALDDFDDFFVEQTEISEREQRKQLLAWKQKIREGFQAEDDANQAAKDKQLRDEEKFQNAKLGIIRSLGLEGFNFLSALNDRAFENQQALANEELALFDQRLAAELDNAKLSADQRLAIEDKFAAERLVIEERIAAESLKLRRRAALIDKASAIFSIILNTAIARIKTIATLGPAGVPLLPFIRALGLAQIAVVAATPLPQFAKGTDSSPSGPAVVGEKGSELMIDKKGNVGLSPNKATIMNLTAGTQIIPTDATERILAGFMGGVQPGYMADLKETNHLLKRISNKPVASSTITPAGVLTMVHKGSTTLRKLDKYFR